MAALDVEDAGPGAGGDEGDAVGRAVAPVDGGGEVGGGGDGIGVGEGADDRWQPVSATPVLGVSRVAAPAVSVASAMMAEPETMVAEPPSSVTVTVYA